METEELFLTFACLLLFFDLIQVLKARPRDKKKLENGFYAAILACGMIVATYFMFLQGFLKDNFIVKEVYSYSSSGLPASYKVFATWAGMSGSMLFLVFMVAIAYFAYRYKTYEKRTNFRLKTYKILDTILIFFVILTLINSPFERYEAPPMDGKGLNPLLQTVWMFIHPPIVFAGYVFIIFAFALVVAGMRTGQEEDRLLKLSLQAAWLLLTAGNAIGGLWAYEVLGWGGYWAWDPVETASLLPWLALTAYFHLAPLTRKGKSLARELILLVTFLSVIFTTALTRGGLAVSVHAFGSSGLGPVLLLFALGTTIYFFNLKRQIKKPLFSMEVKASVYSLSFFMAFWSLILILLVCFWGVAFPIIGGAIIENPMTTGPEFYNIWSFPFVLVFIGGLIGCSTYEEVDLKRFAIVIAGALVAGAFLASAKQPTSNLLANFGIPLVIACLMAVAFRLVRVLVRKKMQLKLFGRSVLHFAIIVTLIGVFFSSAGKLESGTILAKPNSIVKTLGLEVELGNFTILLAQGNVHSMEYHQCVPEFSSMKIGVSIRKGGKTKDAELWIKDYTLHGIVSKPLVIPTLAGDIYLRMLHTESVHQALVDALRGRETFPEDLILTIEKNPMINLVWLGVVLMGIGVAVPLVREILQSPKPGAEK